ncbi:DUF4998 domain-containing protein [Pedobacter sp. PLR]|uniref:DUF4998 domain-containing protein n=1 Tax=Pedobacter sp. PLR TaxID=2994465 RepID=UPI0022470979|nr:DUF4998 domain-containing protein [Pedobacter sp. PLR]
MKLITNKLILGSFILFCFFACTKDGDYSEYLKKAEKIYPGRPDSVVVSSGYNKAQIVSLLSADPRVAKLGVYWNGRRDSIIASVAAADLNKRKAVDIPVIPEGIYTFELATFDKAGNRSVFTEKTGQIYGPAYSSGLVNRVVKSQSTVNGNPVINWFAESDKDSPIFGVEVTYPKIGGDSLKIFTPRLTDVTVLVSAIPTGNFTIKTAYKPKNAIETFYSAISTISY